MIKHLPLAVLFSFFLIPIASDEGLSVNYTFAIFPLMFILVKGKINKPANYIINSQLAFIAIFFIGLFFNLFENINLISRSLISFLIFISPFIFTIIPYNEKLVISFKLAILLTAIYFSLNSITKFIKFSATDIGLIKELIGSQRTGFIHSMAIFLITIPHSDFEIKPLYRNLILILIIIGLFLTFSRTPIISIILTYIVLSASKFKFHQLLIPKSYGKVVFVILSSFIFFLILYLLIPDVLFFFNERLIERFLVNSSQDILVNPETSEGTRVEIWKTILNYCISNPLHGSGYLGAYILQSKIVFGSSHSQYMDVLLRTGFIGILFYLFIIYKTSCEIFNLDKGLFWGFISILFYGLFHETFKESQGGFIFAFLIGYASFNHKKRTFS